jgi:hypothetical protein
VEAPVSRNDPEEEWRANLHRARQLNEAATHCYDCGAQLDVIVVRARVFVGGWGRRALAPLCPACARRPTDEPRPCDGGCGRLVAHAHRRPRRHRFCSDRCERRFYSAEARDRRRQARADRRCDHCGDPIDDDRRADASFCSGRCRQAAFRARKRHRGETA